MRSLRRATSFRVDWLLYLSLLFLLLLFPFFSPQFPNLWQLCLIIKWTIYIMNLYAQTRVCQPIMDAVYFRFFGHFKPSKPLKLLSLPVRRRFLAFLDYYCVRIVEIGDFRARIESHPTLVSTEPSHRRLSSDEIKTRKGTQALEVLLEV